MPTRIYQHVEYSLFSAPDLLDYTNECIAELRAEMSKLPRVDDRGRSECPSAEKLHAQKEKRQRQLQDVLGKLYGHLAGAIAEVRRLERNVTVVQDGKVRLKRREAQEHYDEAQDDLEKRYTQHLQMQNKIWMKIQLVEQVLAEANGKMWPGARPRGQFDLPDSQVPVHDRPLLPNPSMPTRIPSPGPSVPTKMPLPSRPAPRTAAAPVSVAHPSATPVRSAPSQPAASAKPAPLSSEARRELEGLLDIDRRRRAASLPSSGPLPPPLM